MLSISYRLNRTRFTMSLISKCRNCIFLCNSRRMMTATIQDTLYRGLVFTSASDLISSSESNHGEESPIESRRPLDQRIVMHRLRNNFDGRGTGLQLARNRHELVLEFFDLTKSVISGEISVGELEASKTMLDLNEQMNLHIDIFGNAQIVNILASLIKMRANPSLKLIKLLEHEVKFRINTLTLSQVMKLVKFYNSTEMSYEQRQITDMLNNRVRSCLHGNKSSLKDLIDVYNLLANQQAKSSMLGLTEERLLNLLAVDDEDMVTKFLPAKSNHHYTALCDLFVALASAGRRPTPLLKAATKVLTNTPLPAETEGQVPLTLMLSTLNALVSLNYINRVLTSKLIDDFKTILDLTNLDTVAQCSVLRTLGSLKWRSDEILQMFFNYSNDNVNDSIRVDHNLILTLIHVTAQLNYKPEIDLQEFYFRCMTDNRLEKIDKSSRKWLNHVWSLALLGIADRSHFASVLNESFIQSIKSATSSDKLGHTDSMKLLNLRAVAMLEHKIDRTDADCIDNYLESKIQRGAPMQKFAGKIKDALNSMVGSSEEIRHDIKTPFGFIIDSELALDESTSFTSIAKDGASLEQAIEQALGGQSKKLDATDQPKKCALIYVLFDETISNFPFEALGHKQIISRIMQSIGYRTVFLSESVLSRERTSADLIEKLRQIVTGTRKE